MTISYVTGDATQPIGDGTKMIAHIVNDEGKWGSGFTRALSALNKGPELEYRKYWSQFRLGDIQAIEITQYLSKFTGKELETIMDTDRLYVFNMFAQHGIVKCDAAGNYLTRPLDDMALHMCLLKVFCAAHQNKASVHMPRIGCGLAGGKWEEVEPIIQSALRQMEVPVIIYDLPERP